MNKPDLQKTARWTGLVLVPLLLAFAIWGSSPRQTILFVSSFSFQTSALGWLYLLGRNPVLGQFSSRYLSFVAVVWAFFLGGLESSATERIFNDLLHLVVPACVVFHYHSTNVSRYRPLGPIYPLCYIGFMLLVNRWAGYELYPVLGSNPMEIISIFVTVEALHWFFSA